MNQLKKRMQRLTEQTYKFRLFAAKGPKYHYTYGSWRLRRLLAQRAEKNGLSAVNIYDKIDLSQPLLKECHSAAERQDFVEADRLLATHFRQRTEPHFCFEPEEITPLIELISRTVSLSKDKCIQEADKICRYEFDFRRVPTVTFAEAVDWHYCPDGNTDWTWDLNRHTYFETLGRAYRYTKDEKYARSFCTLITDWIEQNPANVTATNWSSVFEVAFRINTWLWAYHLFLGAIAFDETIIRRVLESLWEHGNFLNAYIELHAQNNHVLLEAKALALVGLLFPEFHEADRWYRRGLSLFYQELREQVCADGVHGERATHYHRVVSGELLELLVLLEENAVAIPQDVMEICAHMVEFELWITKPDGQIPLLGDSAQEDVHLRFSGMRGGPAFLRRADLKTIAPLLTESEIWLLGPERLLETLAQREATTSHRVNEGATRDELADKGQSSRAFPDGGYFVMCGGEAEEALYLNFDCGAFGYERDSTHGHADALSFELYAHGTTWCLDPGVYSTHLGWGWRKFFRGTSAHNTIVVDGEDQSILVDGRRVFRPATATLHSWKSSKSFDFVDGEHDGYTRLDDPVTHRRQIFFAKPAYWVIFDTLSGKGTHTFDLLFHIKPDVEVEVDADTQSCFVQDEAGRTLEIVPIYQGDEEQKAATVDVLKGRTDPHQGWVSFYSGQKVAAPTVRYRHRAQAPLRLCTVLYPKANKANKQQRHTLSCVALTVETGHRMDQEKVMALSIDIGEFIDTLLIDSEATGAPKSVVGYRTDAQILYLRQRKTDGLLICASTHGGSFLHFGDQPLVDCKSMLSKEFSWENGL